MVCTLLLQLLIMTYSLLSFFLSFFSVLFLFIYLFMQILLEEWNQIVYKTDRINACVWDGGLELCIFN